MWSWIIHGWAFGHISDPVLLLFRSISVGFHQGFYSCIVISAILNSNGEKDKVQKKIKEGLDQKLQRKFYEDNGYEEKHQQVLNTMENAVAQALKKKKPRKRQVSASSESDSELE